MRGASPRRISFKLEAPPPPRGRSQGHTPNPQFPKPRAGENLRTETVEGGGVGRDEGRREPIIHLPPIPTQKCMKPGPMPKQMPLSTEGAFIRAEMHRPTQHTLFRGGSQINPTRRCMSPSPRSRLGASEGGSESPPRPPPTARPSPGRGRGLCPARGARGATGHGTPPPHPPLPGHVGARPEAPPSLPHVGGGTSSSAWRNTASPPKAENPHIKRYPRIWSMRPPLGMAGGP